MADLKISQLPVNSFEDLNDDDVMPIVNQLAGETRKISLLELDKRWQALPSGGTIGQFIRRIAGDAVEWYTITKATIGLGQVNNTADIDKPLSSAMITALNSKATTAQLALKADKTYVDTELSGKENSLPAGDDGQVLGLVAGAKTWIDPAASGTDTVKYWGDPNTNGTWRQRVDGTLFLTEVRKNDEWVIVSQSNSDDV